MGVKQAIEVILSIYKLMALSAERLNPSRLQRLITARMNVMPEDCLISR